MAASAPGTRQRLSPLVRRLAAEHSLSLDAIAGTGSGGRVRKQDVLAAIAEAGGRRHPARALPTPASAVVPPASMAVPPAGVGLSPDASLMVESLRTSAQLTTVLEADLTGIARLAGRAGDAFQAREGVPLTFLPFVALAAVEALKAHPKLNAVIAGNTVTYHDAEHLGVTVDTGRGPVAPVIRHAGDLNIRGLARMIGDLTARAHAEELGPEELSGATFTVTDAGRRGALFDTPIVIGPQVAILAVGAVARRPVAVASPALGEVLAIRSMAYLALTYDHRLIDGADAARFLAAVKARLEEAAFDAALGL
jgi:2-oxoglutarate dehydrogenase E2 component (dihydrolipoamide succinyltransferase)